MKNKQCAIYYIKNTVTGMVYIGQTIHIKKRFKEHKDKLIKGIHKNKHLQNSWNFHGEKNFLFGTLEFCDRENLNKREIFYIKDMDTLHPNGYNLIMRGAAIGTSLETRKRMSKAAIKRYSIPNSHPRLGKKHSQESIEKNRKSNMNHTPTEEMIYKQKINTPRGEKQHSSKLKEHQVSNIRGLLSTMKDAEISLLYNVSPACIWKIRTGKSWVQESKI